MQLHELTTSIRKRSQRVGRGGKRGTTSGKGTKGQRSRSGHRIRPAVRDLIIRIPKLRGHKNLPKSERPAAIPLGMFALKIQPLSGKNKAVTVTVETLREIGMVAKRHRGGVKVLGAGAIDFPVVLRGIHASESARKKIVAAGGSVE